VRTRIAVAAVVAAAALTCAIAPPAAQAAPRAKEISLTWVGDMSFSRAHGLPPRGGRGFFSGVRPWLNSADLTTGNLEGTLGRGGRSKCAGRSRSNCHTFQAPARYARNVFRRAGFEILNLANNHSRDFGYSGMRQTVRALRGARIAHTGFKGQITVRRVKGMRIAFVGFAPYPWTASVIDIAAAKRLVKRAGRRARAVVVFIHAGAEGSGATRTPHGTETAFGENRGAPRRFAHAVIRSGADAVLGSGPHVLRGIECYRRAVVAYSLGNFASYRTLSTRGVLGLSGVLRVRLDRTGGFKGGRLFPVTLAPRGIPRRDRSRAGVKLVRRLSKADFGRRACRIGQAGRITRR
jgi:poly-gamma-glutamate capsule biosynthesis protein CapA/YwtB (metallophosphatase superfamily)